MAEAAPYLIKLDDTKRRDDIGGLKSLVRHESTAHEWRAPRRADKWVAGGNTCT